ncbi:hypothetical protein ONS95_002855 [Cadophora gregata]|uniref:uncharacterized protein n=1 Tax=Cadophora gregata TaxID=51156 RepID=UPI0026DB1583|nr:uncharacterized protein ONS95_002855 [Cadophora gregata]KAK0108030.1 hypothetical protein ONS95_002855 [Cadophora gregata]KAK0109384.1 hypothetical protein ONS96_003198 [Cadophora gregata f. sp. sojae]
MSSNMADTVISPAEEKTNHWALMESHIEPFEEQVSPQADVKETIDIADVLSKLENERREKNASDAPQAWNQDEAPIFVADEDGRQVDPGAAPEIASPAPSARPTLVLSTTTESSPKMLEESSLPPRTPPEELIFGLRKKIFWLLTLLTLIIITGILAGTIGGILATRLKSSSSPTNPNSSSTPTGSSSQPAKNQMLFHLQTWEASNTTGRSQIFDRAGLFTTAFHSRSFTWIPGFYDDDGTWDVCSMSFCQGDHQLSWRGSSEGRAVNLTRWEGYEYGDTVVVRCGAVFADPGCPLQRGVATMTAPIYDPPAVTEAAVPTGTGTGGNSSVSMSVSGGVTTTTSSGVVSGTAR